MKKLLCILAVLLVLAGGGFWGWYQYETTRDHSGWGMHDGRAYYLDYEGNRLTGWQDIDGSRFCFAEDGYLCTGWQTVDGARRYFLADGALAQGLLTVDGAVYRFDDAGIPYVGWLEEEGIRRYFDDEGKMATEPCTVDGTAYVFLADGSLVTGWYENRYYLEDGTLAQGWMELEGKTLYFQEDGTPFVGWLTLDDRQYYLQADGSLYRGWMDRDGQRLYFREDGSLHHGWLTENGYTYYLKEDGSMAVSPTEIEGQMHYFTPKGIHLWLVNPWNYLPENYEVELVSTEKGYQIAADCLEALEAMLAGCREAGLNPNLISGWRSYWDQLYLYQEKVKEYGYTTGRKIVAEPNTSEHQLGYSVDIVDGSYRNLDAVQGTKPVQLWLMEHCWEYGFILRYPEGSTDITGIIYEPWHYRYVGLEVSLELRELGITLEEYLGAVPETEEEDETIS